MIGFHSDMMWLPEHGVGAVILTNGDPGWIVRDAVPAQAARGAVRRPARGRRASSRPRAKTFYEQLAAERKLLTVPADAGRGRQARRALPQRRARRHRREPRRRRRPSFDFGEWKSEVASRRNPDGTVSFLTTAPGHHRLRVRGRQRAPSAR